MKSGVADKVRAAGGEIYAVTSEPQRLADEAHDDWQLNYETVGDPHHEISSYCGERGWLELIVNPETAALTQGLNSNFSHPKGYFQPGVLALDKTERVLYRWRGVPTRHNMGGATERPTAEHVFEKIYRSMATPSATAADAELDSNPQLDSRGIPWPIFVSLLTANGWFIKPRPFPHTPGAPPVLKRIKRAAARIPFFIGAWALAFSLLPGLWVGIALLSWAAWLTPQVRYINKQFQNVKLA